MIAVEERRYSDARLILRLLEQARPYWPHIGAIFVLGLLSTPLGLLIPLPLKIAVDSVLGSAPLPEFLRPFVPEAVTATPFRLLALVAALQVLIVLLVRLQSLAKVLLSTWTGERLTLAFRGRLFDHIQRLSLGFHDSRGTADSTYRIQYDAPAIQRVAIDGLIPLVSSAIMFVGMIYVTMRINPDLALVALIVSPALGLMAWAYRQRMRPRYREVKRLESGALKVVQETLGAVRVVKAFGREGAEHGRFLDHSGRGMQARIRITLLEGLFGLAVNVLVAIGTAAVLYVGIRGVQRGAMSLGELLVVIAYVAQLYEPLKTLSTRVTSIQSQLASAQRAFEVIDELPEVIERPDARPLERAAGAIEFRRVSFRYDPAALALHEVSFAMAPGTRVGVAGPTGAGKTTLVSLLTRFYDPGGGQITIDGVDLRDYRLADLRNQFAIVLQEPVLFSTSVAENIAYSRPGVSTDDIVEAAKAANAHAFILDLPQGYDTLVGERGMRLSGGERQRIALARAFLKDAPILILDEPTSSVDVGTEAVIMEAMDRLMSGRTVFMIAHRLSTLERCDLLLVLDHGQLVTATTDVASAARAMDEITHEDPALILEPGTTNA
jgi:ATP-binding cassette subfamily B protein